MRYPSRMDWRSPTGCTRRGLLKALGWLVAALAMVVFVEAPALAASTIVLSPAEGFPGDGFQISGGGFAPMEKVQLAWDGAKLGQPISTDGNGAFSASRTVPGSATPGGHFVSAEGRQSKLTADALFVVVAPSSTTTTTTSATTTTTTTTSATTTTTTIPTTTTTVVSATTTPVTSTTAATATTAVTSPGAGAETTTTSETIAGAEPAGDTDVAVTPGSASVGAEIEVVAQLGEGIGRVTIWLGEIQLGSDTTVGEGGSLRVTRTVPDVEPGTYWLRVETTGGDLLGLVRFEVAGPEPSSQATPAESDEGGIWPRGMEAAFLLGLASLGAVSAWLVGRPRSDPQYGEAIRGGAAPGRASSAPPNGDAPEPTAPHGRSRASDHVPGTEQADEPRSTAEGGESDPPDSDALETGEPEPPNPSPEPPDPEDRSNG